MKPIKIISRVRARVVERVAAPQRRALSNIIIGAVVSVLLLLALFLPQPGTT